MPRTQLQIYVKIFTCIWNHLHLYCRGTTQTCLRCLRPVCVCVFHLPCPWVSAVTETGMCRPSDHPDSLGGAAPRGHCLWTSSGSQSGEKMWKRGMQPNKERDYKGAQVCSGFGLRGVYRTWVNMDVFYRVGPHPVSCIPGLFNEVFDLLDVLRYVANGWDLWGQVLHLWDLIIQSWDGIQQVLHCK